MDRETWKLKLSTRSKKKEKEKKVSILHHKKKLLDVVVEILMRIL